MKKMVVLSKSDVVTMLRNMKADNKLTHKQIDYLCGAPRGTSQRVHYGGAMNKHILRGMGLKKEIVYTFDSSLDDCSDNDKRSKQDE